MPNVRIEIRQGRSPSAKSALLQGVHKALVDTLRIPDGDRKLILCEHAPDHFIIPPNKTEQYTMIEITMFAGRSLDAKRHLYGAIVRELSGLGIPPDDVLIVLHEIPLENWGIRGGRPASEVDLGFKVEV